MVESCQSGLFWDSEPSLLLLCTSFSFYLVVVSIFYVSPSLSPRLSVLCLWSCVCLTLSEDKVSICCFLVCGWMCMGTRASVVHPVVWCRFQPSVTQRDWMKLRFLWWTEIETERKIEIVKWKKWKIRYNKKICLYNTKISVGQLDASLGGQIVLNHEWSTFKQSCTYVYCKALLIPVQTLPLMRIFFHNGLVMSWRI